MSQQYVAPHEMTIDTSVTYTATIKTSHGDITAVLYASESPATVNNFVTLARDGFYDGVIFHRVIKNFMIQGGDPTGTGRGGPGYTFADELDAAAKHGYAAGTFAMANAGPNTNGSQFFIVHADAPLPPAYAVFGKAIDGMDVVHSIATTSTDGADRPHNDVVISAIEIAEA